MQTALIHDCHYSTKGPDYWFELLTVTKMLLLIDPLETEWQFKNSIVYEKTAHFCPENRGSDSSTQGACRAPARLSATSCCTRARPFSTTPLSQEATRAAGSLQELLSLDQVLGLYNFLRGGESQKNGYLQMVNSDVNKAKKPCTTWIFPGHLPHCSCPVSKHRTREMSFQMSGVRLLGSAGISDGPLGKLYMEVSPSGIC